MMFEGLPWALLLPLAGMAMIYGSIQAKAEFTKKTKKRKRK